MRRVSRLQKTNAQESEILTPLARLMLAAPQKFLKINIDVRASGGKLRSK
jgi:hypothetical protein